MDKYNILFDIPKNAEKIINTLEKNGYTAYVVGGCVRDSLMGKTPHDWDICTSALPEESKKIFEGFRLIETGIKHGTLTILIDGDPYELTTYRIDGEYTDKRRPDEVQFVSDLHGDLNRRDFTVNAMAYSPGEGIIDYFNARDDLKKGIIRTVGEADRRFGEDALRILRALRFAAVLNFKIDAHTSESIHRNKELLRYIAAERIRDELCKILTSGNPFDLLMEYHDTLCVFMPEFLKAKGFEQNNEYHIFDVWEHTLRAVCAAENDLIVRLALFFHDIGKPFCYTQDEKGKGHFYAHEKLSGEMTAEIMTRLRFDNKTAKSVCELVFNHSADIAPSEKSVKRLLHKLGADAAKKLLAVKRADAAAMEPLRAGKMILELEEAEAVMDSIIEGQECFSLKDLDISGADLLELGIPEGPEIGIILNEVLNYVILGTIRNEREEIIKILNNIRKNIYKI